MNHYEIEVKCLLGTKEKADAFREKLLALSLPAKLTGTHSQLNHYFTGGDMLVLFDTVRSLFSEGQLGNLKTMLTAGKNHSIRTREADGRVLFVVKASIDDSTSSNGVARMEFEEEVPKGMTIDELDVLLLSAGMTYQAKWSRDREEYVSGDITICLDRNAGYGYLAEFEKIVEEADGADAAKQAIAAMMREVGAEELPQDRLERMFAFYNEHWPEYYGTEKVFVVE